MAIYFSPSTAGFYVTEVHGDALPFDALEITAERHAELLAGQSDGMAIVAGAGGYPELASPPPAPAPAPTPVTRVTPRQARLVLAMQASPDPAHPTMLAAIEAHFDAMPEPDRTLARISWEYATEVLRTDPLIEQLKPIIGLDDAQIDALFQQAALL